LKKWEEAVEDFIKVIKLNPKKELLENVLQLLIVKDAKGIDTLLLKRTFFSNKNCLIKWKKDTLCKGDLIKLAFNTFAETCKKNANDKDIGEKIKIMQNYIKENFPNYSKEVFYCDQSDQNKIGTIKRMTMTMKNYQQSCYVNKLNILKKFLGIEVKDESKNLVLPTTFI